MPPPIAPATRTEPLVPMPDEVTPAPEEEDDTGTPPP
jgi:hypothetical protein